jgi:hypothetical protein
VNFITYPFGATILVDGQPLRQPDGTPAITPCTVEGLSACVHRVIFQYPERSDVDVGPVDFSATRQIIARW